MFPGTIIWSSNYHSFILVWVINRMYQGFLCGMLYPVFNFRTYLRPVKQSAVAVTASPGFSGGWGNDRQDLWSTSGGVNLPQHCTALRWERICLCRSRKCIRNVILGKGASTYSARQTLRRIAKCFDSIMPNGSKCRRDQMVSYK